MVNQREGKPASVANRALLAETGETREARELWALGYTKHGWICVGDRCGAQMIPVAWERQDENGQFWRKDGKPFERLAHFRAEPAHGPYCNASYSEGHKGKSLTKHDIGPPSDYPHYIRLFSNHTFVTGSAKQPELEHDGEHAQRQHARWIRSIREACEYYVGHPDQHGRPLQVDRCSGRTYDECFVRFGTGDQRDAGKYWIFYDEILFRKWVELDAEPIRLALLGTIHGNPRTLSVHPGTS